MNRNDKEFLVQKIRTKYTEKESTDLDALKALDAKVKRPANVFAYLFGSVGAVVLGSGMSLVMTEVGKTVGIENGMVAGVLVGAAGLIMTILNYPIYRGILGARRKKYAEKVIALSDQIIKE